MEKQAPNTNLLWGIGMVLSFHTDIIHTIILWQSAVRGDGLSRPIR